MKIDQTYVAWLAGFFDGEGSIALVISTRTGTSGRTNLNIYPCITLTQHIRHRHVLDEVATKLGYGKVYVRAKTVAHYQPTNRADMRSFIELLLPYLRVKQRQAVVILQAIDKLEAAAVGIAKSRGERAVDKTLAHEMVDIAVALNPRTNGTRINGRSDKELRTIVNHVYET